MMGCLQKLVLFAKSLPDFIKVFVLKVALGVFDVVSDIVNGCNFLSGQFLLSLYFASQTREEYDLLTDSATWGYQTIALPWLPGLFRIGFIAFEEKWSDIKYIKIFKRIFGYTLMLMAWPLFSPLMLTLGLCNSWRDKTFRLFEVDWSYELAMISKGHECCLEAGLQLLLQTYIQMRTGWLGAQWWRQLSKAYMEDGVWRYYKNIKFTTPQIIGSLSLPISFISLLSGTISWHFHVREILMDNLSLMQKMKVAPFFLSIIITKVWTMAHFVNSITTLTEAYTDFALVIFTDKLLPFIFLIGLYLALHMRMKFSFKSSLLGSVASLTTLWRPVHDESQQEKTATFYQYETLLSCLLNIFFALLTIIMEKIAGLKDGNKWNSLIALGFAGTNCLITQLYINCFHKTLFPKHLIMTQEKLNNLLRITTAALAIDKNLDTIPEITQENSNSHSTKAEKNYEKKYVEKLWSEIPTIVITPPLEEPQNATNLNSISFQPSGGSEEKPEQIITVIQDSQTTKDANLKIIHDNLEKKEIRCKKEEAQLKNKVSRWSYYKTGVKNKTVAAMNWLKNGEIWIWMIFLSSLFALYGVLTFHLLSIQGWHDHPGINDNRSTEMKCTAPNNLINLNVPKGKLFIIHSCQNMRLWIRGMGHGQSELHLVLLAAGTVEIEEIISNAKVKIYSDAYFTYIRKIQSPSINLSGPRTISIGNNSYFNIDLSIFGPRFLSINNSVMFKSAVGVKNVDEMITSNNTFKNVYWKNSLVKRLAFQSNSYISLKLDCKVSDDILGENDPLISPYKYYCSDTRVTISNNSNVEFNYTRDISDWYWKVEKAHNSNCEDKKATPSKTENVHKVFSGKNNVPFRDLIYYSESGKCEELYQCFVSDKNSGLKSAVRLNNVEQIKRLLVDDKLDDKLLIEASKTNAILSADYIMLMNWSNVNERDYLGNAPLHYAALHDSVEVAIMLIDNGATVDPIGQYGHTPLHKAAISDSDNIGVMLLEAEHEVDQKDNAGETALIHAARYNSIKMAKILLDYGAVVEDHSITGQTALHICAEQNSYEVGYLLLEYGANTESKEDRYGHTPLHKTAYNDASRVASLLLKKGAKASVPGAIPGKRTPLHMSAQFNSPQVAELLLNHKAQIDARANVEYTPLHYSAIFGSTSVAELLLNHGANVESRSSQSETPLHLASWQNSFQVAALLLERGARVNVTESKFGKTPLHEAAAFGSFELAKILLNYSASVEARSTTGITALSWAALSDSYKIAELLLNVSANVQATNLSDWTPLHFSAFENSMKVTELLLDSGAEVDAQNNEGETALHLAVLRKSVDVAELLLQSCSNIEVRSKDGQTPVNYAKQYSPEILILFEKFKLSGNCN